MDMQKILQMGQQMQARMAEVQENLERQEVTASAGGGMVTATVDGNGQIKSISIDPSVVDPGDVELLEDLVMAAVNESQNKAKETHEAEMKKVAGGLPFPLKLPGIF